MMLKQFPAGWVPLPHHLSKYPSHVPLISTKSSSKIVGSRPVFGTRCGARRRAAVYDGQDYQNNLNIEIAMLESYTQSVRNEVLFVTAFVDHTQLQLLIFKGYSSCLSTETPSDPSTSVVPATAVIKSIDRIRGPFDPSDIHYIEKGLTFDEFKTRLRSAS